MLQDLDATLASLIQTEISLPGITISFATPDDQFPPSGVALPAIAFFLYDVREDHELRTNQWENARQPTGVVIRKRVPARVCCSYLITAWPNESVPSPSEDEHRLLGAVLKVLLRHREIPAEHLKGELATQAPLLPARVSADSQLQGIGEFWQAMGGRPKATLHYSVTLSVDVFDSIEVGPEVTETVVRLGSGVDHES